VSPLAVKKAISAGTLPFTGTEFQAQFVLAINNQRHRIVVGRIL
jgi:hypothetical protein